MTQRVGCLPKTEDSEAKGRFAVRQGIVKAETITKPGRQRCSEQEDHGCGRDERIEGPVELLVGSAERRQA